MSPCLPSERLSSPGNPGKTDPLPPVRRALFGPVDHAELQRELSSKLREISDGDQRRWNFSFRDGQPLTGAFQWEESPAEDCPRLYREQTCPPVSPGTRRLPQRPSRCGSPLPTALKERVTRIGGKPNARVHTKRLTDFYGKRKKTDSVCKESRTMERKHVIVAGNGRK